MAVHSAVTQIQSNRGKIDP